MVAVARTGKCPGISLETFSKVVEAVYDCALDPSHWPETLGLIIELSRSQNSSLEVCNLESPHGDDVPGGN
jgi:hypothetical protein